jgi:hypothetical protein
VAASSASTAEAEASAAATATARASALTKGFIGLSIGFVLAISLILAVVLLELGLLLHLDILVRWRENVGQHGDEDIGSTIGVFDFEEWMLVIETLFAYFAVVKVSADAALVTDSDNWEDIATVTLYTFVHDFAFSDRLRVGLYWLLDGTSEVLALQKLVEDLA